VVDDTYSYPSVSTSKDADFVGDWDSTWDNRGSSQFLCGQESYHDNYKEDRRYKFKKCLNLGTENNLEVTEWDGQWEKSCGCYNDGNAAITGAWSQHNNYKEDRLFTFECGELNPKYKLVSCGWTGYVNNWDGELNFECTNNGLIRSMWSRHDNYKEDRLWRFECCQTAYTMSSGHYEQAYIDYEAADSIPLNPSNPSNPLDPSNDFTRNRISGLITTRNGGIVISRNGVYLLELVGVVLMVNIICFIACCNNKIKCNKSKKGYKEVVEYDDI